MTLWLLVPWRGGEVAVVFRAALIRSPERLTLPAGFTLRSYLDRLHFLRRVRRQYGYASAVLVGMNGRRSL